MWDKDAIDKTLKAMDNKVDLNVKYRSVYLTLDHWLEISKEKYVRKTNRSELLKCKLCGEIIKKEDKNNHQLKHERENEDARNKPTD